MGSQKKSKSTADDRLDRIEAALEKAGYMVWDDSAGRFRVVGEEEPVDQDPETAPPQ